jgi:CheY-like chemotaxis protein
MDVFIIRPRSREVATHLRGFLDTVVQRPKYFVSTEDIESGAVWEEILAGQLEASHVGIICLTSENIKSDWIHFEAGAVSKVSATAIVIPYLIGIESAEITGPLTKFQFARADKTGTLSVVQTINTSQPKTEQTDPERVKKVFEKFWPELEEAIQRSCDLPAAERKSMRSQEDILREVLDRIRAIERQIVGHMPPVRAFGKPKSIVLAIDSDLTGKNILWVDDHPENNKNTGDTFKNAGADIIVAIDTENAMLKLEERGFNEVDLVITDMTRGDNSAAGLEFLRWLRGAGYAKPVIVYSPSSEAKQHRPKIESLHAVGPVVGPQRLVEAVTKELTGQKARVRPLL